MSDNLNFNENKINIEISLQHSWDELAGRNKLHRALKKEPTVYYM